MATNPQHYFHQMNSKHTDMSGKGYFTDHEMQKHGDTTAIDIRSGRLIDAIRVK